MPIEVVYALPARQVVRQLTLAAGMTAGEAVMQSGLPGDYTEIRPPHCALSCFGKRIDWNTLLHDGDRVEILRPLQMDALASRRRRIEVQRARRQKR